MKNLKTATRKEKQLQQELEEQRAIRTRLVEENGSLREALEKVIYRHELIAVENRHLANGKAEREEIQRITAESLRLERDELLVRVRRIEMRVKGLGFDV